MNFINFTEYTVLKTEKLILRKATDLDIAVILELRSSEEINKFVGTKRIQNLEEASAFIKSCNSLYDQHKRIFWLIEFQNQVIGSIVLHNISKVDTYAEIGYKLKPNFQQKGIMTEALQKVITFGFDKLALTTIEAFTHKNNIASIALLEKNGFVFLPKRKCSTFNYNRIFKLESKL